MIINSGRVSFGDLAAERILTIRIANEQEGTIGSRMCTQHLLKRPPQQEVECAAMARTIGRYFFSFFLSRELANDQIPAEGYE